MLSVLRDLRADVRDPARRRWQAARTEGRLMESASSRSYSTIVRANVFTVFNVVLLVAGVVTLAFGEWQDALFLGVVVGNSSIGIVQEVRATRALDRLSALVAPVAAVVLPDGTLERRHVDEVRVGDRVAVQPGDQVVADGVVAATQPLQVDESILTGESESVEKVDGDQLHSGSFVVEGTGHYVVRAVGADSFAAKITGEARTFRHPRSPLQLALNQLLIVLVAVMVPLGLLYGFALSRQHVSFHAAVPQAVAAVVSLIPEGLVLLASLAYAVGSLRAARHRVLEQQLGSLESLSTIDVICLDKTGTLTEPDLRVVEQLGEDADLELLGRYAASSSVRNSTLVAIAAARPGTAVAVDEERAFSSRSRWGGMRIDGIVYKLGAPELFTLGELASPAERAASSGRRVLAFGTAGSFDAAPMARVLVVLAEQLRPRAKEIVRYFQREGVELKVLSGDRPETVAAIARDSGLQGEVRNGGELPLDDAGLDAIIGPTAVIGRIDPAGKRRVIESLQRAGRRVAMVGDGVNDVPALKAANVAIAQGSGTAMARAVSDLVLLDSDFQAVPSLIEEGRKILRNVQRVSKLFVTKSTFATFLILSIGLTSNPYPFLPRQLTLAATTTVGIPAFFLAIAPSSGPYRLDHLLMNLARFAVPAGFAAGLGVLSSFLFTINTLARPTAHGQTVATIVLVTVGLYLVLVLEAVGRARTVAISLLVATLAAGFALMIALPTPRSFFHLVVPDVTETLTCIVGASLAITALVLVDERFLPGTLAEFVGSRVGRIRRSRIR
jgi:P-type E1-E2 ATPase